jgi:SAM-dependent methyltransferase
VVERFPSEMNSKAVCSSASAPVGKAVTDPRQVTLEAHRDYYAAGGYDNARLAWTLDQFLPSLQDLNILEVGFGDGAMLQLLTAGGANAQGIDASSSGISRCHEKGLAAQCLDVSTDGAPFPDQSFDAVISLETFEHLMNPFYALQEVRRVLRDSGRFICSVPNPLTGHPYLYPGLFEYANFRKFLGQGGFRVRCVRYWQWAPRETILPPALRRVPLLRGRIVAGGLRRLIEMSYRLFQAFPAFCYWLWTFDCQKVALPRSQFENVSLSTMPGSEQHRSPS